jgi:tripartite-type tricarboxylate transporter receptor subunit TctC
VSMRHRLTFLTCLAVTASAAHATRPAVAQNLPDRPIKLVVPSAPAGGTDILARNLAQKLGEKFGLTIVVENKVGAGSIVGTNYVAKSVPDGTTLMMGGLFNMVMNSALVAKLPYDPLGDFTVVDYVSAYPFVALTNPGLGVSTLRGFVDYAKARPGELNVGSAGLGTLHHVWGTILTKSLGLDMAVVHYRGAAPAQQDLIAGRLQFLFDNVSAARGLVQDGRVTALGVSSPVRTKLMPDVPTINESGLLEFSGESWFGVFAPAKTPEATRVALRKALNEVVHDPTFIVIVERDGGRLLDVSPEKQSEFLRGEVEHWSALVRKYDVRAE